MQLFVEICELHHGLFVQCMCNLFGEGEGHSVCAIFVVKVITLFVRLLSGVYFAAFEKGAK